MRASCEVAIVGSGFSGSLLARILARLGYEVVLLERGRHPRFAIGESSTPLANLCLERLSRRYDLPDLYELAAHGRWLRSYPELRRGLKRGFTFYRHAPGAPFRNDTDNSSRLLVAASPNDRVADTQWLRADIDHHFVRQAVAAGVDYRDLTTITELELGGREVRLRGEREGRPLELRARMVVDASGPGGFLRRQLPIASNLRALRTRAALVFSHLAGARLFAEVAREAGGALEPGPYPDDWAAVHHLIEDGWMYVLRFDDGVVSAGFLLSPRGMAGLDAAGAAARPQVLWRRLLARYPSIGAQLAHAEPLFPVGFVPRVQHRLRRAAGERWVLLPHTFTFVDPLFSTGIAWSLLAVERLALAFEEAVECGGTRLPARSALRRYEALLERETDQVDRLVHGAYLALADFPLFVSHALLYFVAVSFAEVRQRVEERRSWAWEGFLGVRDPVLGPLFTASHRRLHRATDGGRRAASDAQRQRFAAWVTSAAAPRNVAGLADPRRRNLYPVDIDVLLERAHLLGLSRERFITALPRLRGFEG